MSIISLRDFRGLVTCVGTNVGREALRLFLEGTVPETLFCVKTELGAEVCAFTVVVRLFCEVELTTLWGDIYTTLGPEGLCCSIPIRCCFCCGEAPCWIIFGKIDTFPLLTCGCGTLVGIAPVGMGDFSTCVTFDIETRFSVVLWGFNSNVPSAMVFLVVVITAVLFPVLLFPLGNKH